MSVKTTNKKYRLYNSRVPGSVFEGMKILSIKLRKEMLLKDLVSLAIKEHIEKVRRKERPAIMPDLESMRNEEWEEWTLSIESDVYKQARILKEEYELDMFDFIASAFIGFLKDN